MRTTDKPATKTDVTRAMATISASVTELVTLLGHPDDAVSEEAARVLARIGELAVKPLAAAIRRPISPLHRIKAIFAIKFIHPRNPLPALLALSKVEKSENDERIAKLASRVLFMLTFDDLENRANQCRWQRLSSDDLADTIPVSLTDRQSKLVEERLSELRAQE